MAVAAQIPARHPGSLFGGGATVAGLQPTLRGLPPVGPRRIFETPMFVQADSTLDPAAALEAARQAS